MPEPVPIDPGANVPQIMPLTSAQIEQIVRGAKDLFGSDDIAGIVKTKLDARPAMAEEDKDHRDGLIARAAAADAAYRSIDKGTNAVGALCWGLALAAKNDIKTNPEKALEFSLDAIKKQGTRYAKECVSVLKRELEATAKTLVMGDATAGGVFVEGDVSQFFFEPLYAATVVMGLNPVRKLLLNGTSTLTGMETDPTVTWRGEVSTVDTSTEPTSGSRVLNAKWAQAITEVSNAMLQTTLSSRISQEIEIGLRRCFAVGFDEAWLTGAGTAYTPKGLTNWAGNSAGTATASTVLEQFTADFIAGVTAISQANVRMERMAMIFSNRTRWAIAMAPDGFNRPYLQEEMRNGTVFGFPFGSTSSIPVNLGGGTDSEIIMADMAQVVVGDGASLSLRWTDVGSITVSSVVLSAFERDSMFVRGTASTDLLVPHPEAVYKVTGVDY
jgi:HK97 family phage major capsid protein